MLLAYAIALVVLLRQPPKPWTFDDFLQPNSEALILVVGIFKLLTMILVQMFAVNLVSYFYFALYVCSISVILIKDIARQYRMIVLITQVTQYLGYAIFVAEFVFASPTLVEFQNNHEDTKRLLEMIGVNTISQISNDWLYSLSQVFSLILMLIFCFQTNNLISYHQTRAYILELRERLAREIPASNSS